MFLNSKYYDLQFSTATEAHFWYEALRNLLHYQNIFNRCQYKAQKHNIEILYHFMNENQSSKINEYMRAMIKSINTKNKTKKFITNLRNFNTNLRYFCDGFFARTPFNDTLFHYCILFIHKYMVISFNTFWNKKYKKLNALEIINFMNGIWNYNSILNTYGIYDFTLADHVKPLLNTFLLQIFNNSQKILHNILKDFKVNIFKDKNFIRSKFSENVKS